MQRDNRPPLATSVSERRTGFVVRTSVRRRPLKRRLRTRAGGVSRGPGLQRQMAAADRQIDRLVYDLYDLTEEEIAIVEGNA